MSKEYTDVLNRCTSCDFVADFYWNYQEMPHDRGIVLTYLDGHAARMNGSPKEHDWWAYHSRDGWEEGEYTCGNSH